MENKKEKIEKEIDKIFEQFNNADKLIPDPHFYSKVKQRLESEDKKKKLDITQKRKRGTEAGMPYHAAVADAIPPPQSPKFQNQVNQRNVGCPLGPT